jgi:hypothetical protein
MNSFDMPVMSTDARSGRLILTGSSDWGIVLVDSAATVSDHPILQRWDYLRNGYGFQDAGISKDIYERRHESSRQSTTLTLLAVVLCTKN